MFVDPKDGRCHECRSGILKIVDADDVTMTVECQNQHCRATYPVETDAFGDGCMTYYPTFMAQRQGGGDAEDA